MLKDKLVVIKTLDAEGKAKGVLHHIIYEDEKPKCKLIVQGVKTDSYCAYQDIPNLWVKNKRIKWLYK
jgi:hypothetical protein